MVRQSRGRATFSSYRPHLRQIRPRGHPVAVAARDGQRVGRCQPAGCLLLGVVAARAQSRGVGPGRPLRRRPALAAARTRERESRRPRKLWIWREDQFVVMMAQLMTSSLTAAASVFATRKDRQDAAQQGLRSASSACRSHGCITPFFFFFYLWT